MLVDLLKELFGLAADKVRQRLSSKTVQAAPAIQQALGAVSQKIVPLSAVNYLVHGRHGWFVANGNDFYLGYALMRYGEYAEQEGVFLASLLRTGDNVVEVGANIGSHTVGLAQKVGQQGRVIAIEPQPVIHQYLCANLALNSLFNVTTHNCGCGASEETLTIPPIDYAAQTQQNFGGVSLLRSQEGIPVKVFPLDQLAGELPSLRLLKIDVEGMEGEVIKGASDLISRFRPCIYVENDRVEKSRALIEQLMAHDYRLWWHIPGLFNPENHFGEQENIYGNVASFNMLCLPREVQAQVEDLVEITDSSFHPLSPKGSA